MGLEVRVLPGAQKNYRVEDTIVYFMREEIIELTKRLVSIPSVSGNRKESLCALHLAEEFLADVCKVQEFKHQGYTSFLWNNNKNAMRAKVLLLGHLDVVDADKSLFIPKIEGELLTGRGTGDMKGHVAVMLWCFREILLKHTDADVALLLTTDEELGGFNGSRYLVDSGLNTEILFVPDGGENFNIVTSEKAPHHFVIEAKGRGGHASRAFELDNPINKLMSFYYNAQKEFDVATSNKAWASTFEMTTIESNSKAKNKIPSVARASFSWRWPLEQIEFKTGRNKLLKLAKKHECEVIEEEGWGEGTLIDINSSAISIWKNIVEKNLGRKVKFTHAHGASDARHFFNSEQFGTKNIIITSATTGDHHSPDEWVSVKSLETLSTSLFQFLEDTLSLS